MSIRIGIYDFFAYTVPGGLMLLILLGALDTSGVPDIWVKLFALNTFQFFLLIVGCYLTGFVCSPFLSKWSVFFEPKQIETDILEQFKKRNPALAIDIHPAEWPIWLASIRRENLDIAVEIDRNMAVSKMVRGVSLFLLLGAALALANVVMGRISAWYLPAIAIAGWLSILTVRESIKFKRWFYLVIFETVVSRQERFTAVK